LGDEAFAKHTISDLDFFICTEKDEPIRYLDAFGVSLKLPEDDDVSEILGLNVDVNAHLRFLDQFHDINSRWGGYYETLTEDMLSQAARFQTYLVGGDSSADDNRQWVILLALRCLVAGKDIDSINNVAPRKLTHDMRNPHYESFECEVFSACKVRTGFRPNSFELEPYIQMTTCEYAAWRYAESPMVTTNPSGTLCSLLSSVVDALESLLLQAQPKDWPTAFYTLYILQLVQWDLSGASSWTDVFECTVVALNSALARLTELFLQCCGDLHPFSDDLDLEWYGLLVGPQFSHCVDHYEYQYSNWAEHRVCMILSHSCK
jgi:hypothetical protein